MPTYQYACTACGHQLEAVQTFSDAALTECPACAGRLRKLFSSVGIVFKGSGFYRNDARSATSAEATSNGASAGGKESKPGAGESPGSSGSAASDSGSSTPAATASTAASAA